MAAYNVISKNAHKWYQSMLLKACQVSHLSDMNQYKIGSVLVYKKSIISVGFNKKKTHPIQYFYNNQFREKNNNFGFIHAEVDCIKDVHENILKDSILFVGRINKDGNFALARPCDACMQMIIDHEIKVVVYTTNNGYAIEYLNKMNDCKHFFLKGAKNEQGGEL